MIDALRGRISSAHVLAMVALFVALGGTSYAAVKVNGKNVKKGTITSRALRNRTITGAKVKQNSLGGTEINESKLGKVPSAGSADTAASAGTAASVGGQTAASLHVQCPAGTVAAGGVCIELAQRAAKDWNQASIDCGARGLPNLSQLLSFISSHPGLTGTEWSSNLFDATTLGVIDVSTGIVAGSANTPHPYRCMTTPAN
jgi:DNA-binding protein